MRILPSVQPTPEQLGILSFNKPGVLLLHGAAGSGKTTTALLRLKQQARVWLERRQRLGSAAPVHILVLTYNRTLEGYIAQLAREQVTRDAALDLTVSTFSKWALRVVREDQGRVEVLDASAQRTSLHPLLRPLPLQEGFGLSEVEYLLGRYEPGELDRYITDERTGRGLAPRVDQALRRRLLDEVVTPYGNLKSDREVIDWNDVALAAGATPPPVRYDVVIIDEAQDFSANQMRAVLAHLAEPHSMTVVMDAAQRIYPRSFTWKDVGLALAGTRRLTANHRNTRQVAALARSLLNGVQLGDDATLPDLSAASTSGPTPVMLEGKFSGQMRWVLHYLDSEVDPGESVAFLQVRGGNWFSYIRDALDEARIDYCELTRTSDWPQGPEEIALVTFHSSKGLEFDHVIMLGLNQQLTPHGRDEGDVELEDLRRLVAMGIGRARRSVVLGHKPSDASTVISLFDPATYRRERV